MKGSYINKTVVNRYAIVFATTAVLLTGMIPVMSGDTPFLVNIKVSSDVLGKEQNEPAIAVDDSGNIYVAWEDNRNTDYDIYFAASTDGGTGWTDPNKKINTDGGSMTQGAPTIATYGTGNVYIAWEDSRSTTDKDIYFANSTDGGATFSDPNVRINTDAGTATQSDPALAVDSLGTVYAVWEDYRNTDADIYFAKSTDGGLTWTHPNVRVNRDATTTNQRNPSIAVDSMGYIYVAWQDEITGYEDINFSQSKDGGATWSDPSITVNTDGAETDQTNPNIAVDSNDNIYCVWQDRRSGDWDIYYAMSTNEGNTWTDPNVKINTDGGVTNQQNPAVAVGLNNNIYVAWQDLRLGDNDIYFAESSDGGVSWSNPNLRVNDDATGKTQVSPAVAVDATVTAFVVWEDRRNDNYDIYFSGLVSGAALPPKPTADGLGVDGFLEGSGGIDHIITDTPVLNFTYNDHSGDAMSRYNISVWDSGGSSLLWFYNTTSSLASGSDVEVTYNTAPAPTDSPPLEDGTTYKLRVRVANATDVWSVQSEVDFHLNEVLVPSGPTPADDALIATSDTQTVSWTSPGADSEGDTPVSYNWEVATDSAFSNIIVSGSGASTESDAFDAGTAGIYYWRVNLSDGYETGSFGNQPDGFWNFTTYNATTTNNEPTITNKASAPATATVGSKVSFTFEASDADSDPLTWSMVAGVSWLHIGPQNGTLYGTPSSQDVGAREITIQVADGKGGTDTHTFTLTVSDITDGDGDGEDDGLGIPWFIIILIIVILIIIIALALRRR